MEKSSEVYLFSFPNLQVKCLNVNVKNIVESQRIQIAEIYTFAAP